MARYGIAAGVILVGFTSLVACSGGSKNASAVTTPPVTVASTPGTSASSSSASPSAPAPETPSKSAGSSVVSQPKSSAPSTARTTAKASATKPCTIKELKIYDSGKNKVQDGMAYGSIIARKLDGGLCTINGYPGVRLGSDGAMPTTLMRANGPSPTLVTLAQGDVASFTFSHKNYVGCSHSDNVEGARIYDPDGSGYQVTTTRFNACAGFSASGLDPVPFTVTPFRAGSAFPG